MEVIYHRINTIKELTNIPSESGVEIDLRDFEDEIILQHEPFIRGENFEEFLKAYGIRKGTLILNIKSERIEFKVKDLLIKYHISNYFYLDCSFPMIINLIKQNERKIALRYSEYEKEDTILNLTGKINWIWIDCFTEIPENFSIYSKFKELGFKICLVSPELQGQPEKINEYKRLFKINNIQLDAVCTKKKYIDQWQYH